MSVLREHGEQCQTYGQPLLAESSHRGSGFWARALGTQFGERRDPTTCLHELVVHWSGNCSAPVLLFKLLQAIDARVIAAESKVHLATSDAIAHPLDVYRGAVTAWERWQCVQARKNFNRSFVVSLIEIPGRPDCWLFPGVYKVAGVEHRRGRVEPYTYDLRRIKAFGDLEARLVVRHQRTSRAPYRLGETIEAALHIEEISVKRLTILAFPGFKQVHISYSQLLAIVKAGDPTWQAALSSVSGIYVLTDTSDGRLYVGSAYGAGGIWARWSQYLNKGTETT